MDTKSLKIGTRGSPLALLQTEMVEGALKARLPDLQIERVVIRTTGDWKPEQGEKRLSEAEGGKGLFAREIELALLDRTIDCAVHSLKDMPSFLPEGLALDHMLERADPRDAFICHKVSSYMDLPQGAVVGTSSLRRQAFLLAKRPDLKIVPIRGNVQTRLAKLAEGQVDATYLAMAGLDRLGISGDFIHPVSMEDMLP
ncbi:MAG: hydroxymethylbilane synthase, partial [Micavibrio aeruginosavorus]